MTGKLHHNTLTTWLHKQNLNKEDTNRHSNREEGPKLKQRIAGKNRILRVGAIIFPVDKTPHPYANVDFQNKSNEDLSGSRLVHIPYLSWDKARNGSIMC